MASFRPSKKQWAIASMVVVLLAGLFWLLRSAPPIRAVTNRLVASDVKPTVVIDPNATDERVFVAVALSEQAVDLVAPSTGVITEVSVELGTEVPANTPVVKMRAEDVTRDLAEAEALAKQAGAEVSKARAEVRDAEQKLQARKADGVVSDEERKSAQLRVKVSLANLEVAKRHAQQNEARAVNARYHADQLTVRTPFAGFVSGKYQNPGSTVPSGTRLLRFIGSKQPIVRFAVPHQRATSFKVGDRAAFRPDPSPDSAPKPATVAIARIAPEADPHSGLVVVEAAFAEGEENIRPGTVGRVELAAVTPVVAPTLTNEAPAP